MRRIFLVFGFGFFLLLILGCNRSAPPEPSRHNLPAGVRVIDERNGVISPRSLGFHYQDVFNPRLAQLKIDEDLDAIVSEGKNEIDRMRLLRDWVSGQWESSMPDPYPRWDAVSILRQIRSGKTGGFCAQYAVVLVQSSLALGLQARYLAIAAKDRPDNGHMTVEIWSNELNKWVVMDPYFCVDFERDKKPIGALEIHNALVKGELDKVKINFGKDFRKKSPGGEIKPEHLLSYYHHVSFEMRNDHITRPHNFWNRQQEYLSWRDRHTDGRPKIFSIFTSDEDDFNFPINEVEIILTPGREKGLLICHLRTNMPSMKSILVRKDEENWHPIHPRLDLNRIYGSTLMYTWNLHPGENSLQVRAVNELGIKGPVSMIQVDFRPK